jgi:DNA-binding CsgD family transcriptional regulator
VPALAAAARCVEASRRFRLPTLGKALVLGAAAEDYLGRADAAEAACAEALRLEPDDTHLRGEVWGIRAYRALAAADDTRALDLLERAMAAFALRPSEVTGSPAVGLWVLLRTITDTDVREPPATPDTGNNRWNRGFVGLADAVARGRRGDVTGAEAAFAEADAVLRDPVDARWHRLQGRRLVGGAALADGWGDPAGWASRDLAMLEGRGQDRWAAALRGLIRRSGGVVPRRGRGDAEVPAALRALGVTSRETDILLLVADGRTNKEIAERLFLSPRTVEKHVERLLAKTGTQRRTELVAYAARAVG